MYVDSLICNDNITRPGKQKEQNKNYRSKQNKTEKMANKLKKWLIS